MDESHRSPEAGGDQTGPTPTHSASSPWAPPTTQPTTAGSPPPASAAAPQPADAPQPLSATQSAGDQPPFATQSVGAPTPDGAVPGQPAPHQPDRFGETPVGAAPGGPHVGANQPGPYAGTHQTGPHQTGPHQTGPHQHAAHQTGPFPVWTAGGTSQPATSAGPAGRRRGPVALAIAGGALVLALVAGGTGAAVGVAVSDRSSGNGVTINQQTSAAQTRTDTTGTVESAAAAALKSVVTISVTTNSGAGTGSGVVLDSQGRILTNNHVVEDAASGGTITVTLTDGRTRTATIVGRDPSSDIAVIEVSDTSGLTPATFAASSTVKTGQTVLAVGAPLGLSNTVTEGIVSALNRPVRTGSSADQNTVIDAVQTDAAINPGNSGGALVDLSGRVVGINSAIATVSNSASGNGQESQSGNIGVGFAIPSDTALKVAEQLIEDGTAEHSTLGVSAQDTQTGTGAQIAQVTSGSAADKAGLKTGDVVTAIGDRRVTDTDGLVAAVRSHDPGESVKVTYQRGGRSTTTTATLNSSAT